MSRKDRIAEIVKEVRKTISFFKSASKQKFDVYDMEEAFLEGCKHHSRDSSELNKSFREWFKIYRNETT